MLVLPRSVAEVAQQDMWLCVLLGGMLFLLSLIIVIRLAMYFPDNTILEYAPILLGPVLGQTVNVFLLVLIIWACTYALLFYYQVNLPPNLQTIMKIGGLLNKPLITWGIGVLPLLLLLAWRKKGKQC